MAEHGLPLNWRLPWIQLQIRCQSAIKNAFSAENLTQNKCNIVQKHTRIGVNLEKYKLKQ